MIIIYPHKIKNSSGETLIFHALMQEPGGDRIVGENFVLPGCGPPMHIHWLQDECFTVINGTMGYQLQGGPEKFLTAGQSVLFPKGVAHRFWNAGPEVLNCSGWIKPAHSIVYFLSCVFAAQNKTGTSKPAMFDAAFLLRRYRSEYDMTDIPVFVKRMILPVVYYTGMLLGKYKHFKDAPNPVKSSAVNRLP